MDKSEILCLTFYLRISLLFHPVTGAYALYLIRVIYRYDITHLLVFNLEYICLMGRMVLKQYSAALLLLSFMAQALSSPFIVFDYYVNTASYAKRCVNKARTELHCNGKCQMAKGLEQQEEREQQSPVGENSYKTPVFLFSKSWLTFAPAAVLSASANNFPVFQDTHTKDISLMVFRPPRHSAVSPVVIPCSIA
ncbi:MAG TPA: hypothetical protein PLL71_17280 [Agriterribacter sp.]|nr:hypothetical protein [Agriterribacter sp.]HRQ51556.1 hypothetical protein [Agriterribacter sp.]